MKSLYYILFIFFVSLFLSACSQEGSSSFTQEKVDISVSCVDTPSSSDIDTYLTLNSGDSIVQDEENSQVSTYHSLDGVKKVCLNSGKAHIVRK